MPLRYCAVCNCVAQELFSRGRAFCRAISQETLRIVLRKMMQSAVDFRRARQLHSTALLGGRPMVGLQTLDLAIGVRVPASQPKL